MTLKAQNFTVTWNVENLRYSRYAYVVRQQELIDLLAKLKDPIYYNVEVHMGHIPEKKYGNGAVTVAGYVVRD